MRTCQVLCRVARVRVRIRGIGTIKSPVIADIEVVARAKLQEADKTWLPKGIDCMRDILRKLNRTFGILCQRIIYSRFRCLVGRR